MSKAAKRKFSDTLDQDHTASKCRRRISVTVPAYTEETLYALGLYGKFKDQSDVVSQALLCFFKGLDTEDVDAAFERWEKENP